MARYGSLWLIMARYGLSWLVMACSCWSQPSCGGQGISCIVCDDNERFAPGQQNSEGIMILKASESNSVNPSFKWPNYCTKLYIYNNVSHYTCFLVDIQMQARIII